MTIERFETLLLTAVSALMSYILAPSSLAGRGLGVGFLYLITWGSAVSVRSKSMAYQERVKLFILIKPRLYMCGGVIS